MKKIKTINKLLSSLTLLSPLSGIGFNNQHQITNNNIIENKNFLDNVSESSQAQMGDITVTVDGTKIIGYVSGEGTLQVSSNITEIGLQAFKGNAHISSLDLSNATSLTTIDQSAFANCTRLSNDIVFPNALTTIAASSFAYCDNLSIKISIPSNVTTIASSAFSDTPITSLDLSQATSLTTIGYSAFYNCTNLSGEIFIPENLSSIESYAFQYDTFSSISVSERNHTYSTAKNLGEKSYVLINRTDGIWNDNAKVVGGLGYGDIVLSSEATKVADGAFDGSNIASLDLSQATNLITIGDTSFRNCLNLSGDLYIPKSLTKINKNSFRGVKFSSIKIDPENQNFSFATNLGKDAKVLLNDNTGIWSQDSTTLNGLIYGTIVFPSTTTEIRAFSFNDVFNNDLIFDFSKCTNLSSIGSYAFCSNCWIKNLDFSRMKKLTYIGAEAFDLVNWKQSTLNIDFRNLENNLVIGNSIFSTTQDVELAPISGNVYFPDKVTSIGSYLLTSSKKIDNICFTSETPPTFEKNWITEKTKNSMTGKVYVPSEQAKQAYLSAENFGFSEDQIEIGLPTNFNIGLVLGLLFGLGIPIIAASVLGYLYLNKNKKNVNKKTK